MQSSRAQNLLRQIEEVVSGMLRQYQPLDDRTATNMSFIVSDSISNRQSAQSASSIRQLIRAASFNGIKGRGGQVVVSQYGTYGIDVYPFETDGGVVAGGQLYTLAQMCSLSLRNYLYNPKTEELAKPGVYYVVISGTNLIGLTTVVTPDTPVLAKVVIPGIYTSAISDTEIWRSYAGMPADAIEEAEQSAKAFIVSARDPFFETGEGFIADDYFMRTIRDAFTNLQAENITGTLRLSEALSIENAGGTLKATSSNIQFFDATGAVLAEYGREKARVGGIEIYPDRIQSANYAYGYAGAGFIIRQNGYANFNDVEVRGSIIGSTIDIGGDDSTSFHVDIDGNLWSGDGDFVDAPFSVTSEGLVTAYGGRFSTARSGPRVSIFESDAIGFAAYTATGHDAFKIYLADTGGYSAGDVFLGDGGGSSYAHWDDSAGQLIIKGAISASTIDIGGADATSFHVDADGNIWSGAALLSAAPFKVTNAGVMSAVGGSFVSSTTGGRVEIFPNGEGGDVGIRVYDEEITPRVSFQVDISGTTAGDVTIGDYAHGQGALWDASDNAFRILGAISASTIDIGGADTTSFHVDINGNIWSGAATFANGVFKVSNSGDLTATNADITGSFRSGDASTGIIINSKTSVISLMSGGVAKIILDAQTYDYSHLEMFNGNFFTYNDSGDHQGGTNITPIFVEVDSADTAGYFAFHANAPAQSVGHFVAELKGAGTGFLYVGKNAADAVTFSVNDLGNIAANKITTVDDVITGDKLIFDRTNDVTVDVAAFSSARTVTIPDPGADADFVMTAGAQTLAGVKTFSSFPVTPSSAPTTDYQVANKKYVDDNAGGGTTHDLLSATHSDTAASAVSRGSILYGNSTPKWAELTIGTSGQVLVSNGTDIAWGGVPGAGSDNWVQYRSGGVLAAESDFTYTPSTNTLAVVNINNSILYSEKYDSGTSFSLATTDAGQDNIILVSGLDDVEQWGYAGSIGFGKINTKDRKSAIFGYQTGSDSDQMGLGFAVHPSGTGSAAMEIGAVLDHAGVLRVPYSGLLAVKELSSSPAALSVPSGTSALAQVFVAYDAAADAYTKLLIHADGAHNSTTFTDLSGTAKSLAATAINSTTQIKFGASSIYFSGSTYIYAADSPDWALGSDNFTIDFWARFSALPSASGYVGLVSQHADANNNWWVSVYNNAGTYSLLFKCRSSSSDIITLAGVIPAGWLTTDTWHHYAVVRNGTLFSFFMDGRYLGTGEDNSAVPDIYANLFIGAQNSTTNMFNGYMDAVRISKGIARWNGPFDPPTVSLNVLDQTGAKYTAKSSSEPLYSFSTIQEYTPSSSTEAGWAGRITYDSDNLYVWVGPASVMVAALSSM